jgi:hypothetical protein
MSDLRKEFEALEHKYDIAIYEVKWWCPDSDSSNIWKRKTEKGVGFAKWCLNMSKYWKGKNKLSKRSVQR